MMLISNSKRLSITYIIILILIVYIKQTYAGFGITVFNNYPIGSGTVKYLVDLDEDPKVPDGSFPGPNAVVPSFYSDKLAGCTPLLPSNLRTCKYIDSNSKCHKVDIMLDVSDSSNIKVIDGKNSGLLTQIDGEFCGAEDYKELYLSLDPLVRVGDPPFAQTDKDYELFYDSIEQDTIDNKVIKAGTKEHTGSGYIVVLPDFKHDLYTGSLDNRATTCELEEINLADVNINCSNILKTAITDTSSQGDRDAHFICEKTKCVNKDEVNNTDNTRRYSVIFQLGRRSLPLVAATYEKPFRDFFDGTHSVLPISFKVKTQADVIGNNSFKDSLWISENAIPSPRDINCYFYGWVTSNKISMDNVSCGFGSSKTNYIADMEDYQWALGDAKQK